MHAFVSLSPDWLWIWGLPASPFQMCLHTKLFVYFQADVIGNICRNSTIIWYMCMHNDQIKVFHLLKICHLYLWGTFPLSCSAVLWNLYPTSLQPSLQALPVPMTIFYTLFYQVRFFLKHLYWLRTYTVCLSDPFWSLNFYLYFTKIMSVILISSILFATKVKMRSNF